jgi:hypothetical protein
LLNRIALFYQKWKIEKLTEEEHFVEQTAQRFEGRTGELFEMLERKYGPELPQGVPVAALRRRLAQQQLARREKQHQAAPDRLLQLPPEERPDSERSRVLAAVRQDGQALKHASEVLKADKEVVMAAVQQQGQALAHATEALKADKEVVMAAVQQQGQALVHATEALKADKEVVMAAVQQQGQALVHAAEALQAEKVGVMAAVQQQGQALAHAA